MVSIDEIEGSFRKFRSQFWEDVVEVNIERREKFEKVKAKMMESDYFKMVRQFAEERGWKIKDENLTLMAQKEDRDPLELPLVSITEDNRILIQPWSRIMKELGKIEEG